MKKFILTLAIVIGYYFSYSQTYDANFLIQNSTVSTKGYLFSSPASNWGPQVSGLSFTPRDGVNATTDFKINLWDGQSGISNRLFIDGYNGNVGIGTTSASAPLHVYGSHPSNTKTIQIGAGTSAAGRFYKADGLDVIDGPLYLQGNYNQNVLIGLGGGNVGIGSITSPSTKLQVSGAISSTNATEALNSSTPIISGNILGPSYSGWGISMNHIVENADYNSYGMGLFTMDSYLTGRTEKFRISSNGNVGIGTTAPDEKLTVKGKIHSQEVIVDAMTTVPDYVFEPNYKLTPLTDLKRYVDQNHHLPNIPSAKEIEKNGIQLGDMNMKLLKKVEEMTLYLIKQKEDTDKQIQLQQDQINLLKRQLNLK